MRYSSTTNNKINPLWKYEAHLTEEKNNNVEPRQISATPSTEEGKQQTSN